MVNGFTETKKTIECEKHIERSGQYPRTPNAPRSLATEILTHWKFVNYSCAMRGNNVSLHSAMFDSARVRGVLRCYNVIDRVVDWVITFLVKSPLRLKTERPQKKDSVLFCCSFLLTSSDWDKNLPTHFREKKRSELYQTAMLVAIGEIFFLFLLAGSCWRTPSTFGFLRGWASSSKKVTRGAFFMHIKLGQRTFCEGRKGMRMMTTRTLKVLQVHSSRLCTCTSFFALKTVGHKSFFFEPCSKYTWNPVNHHASDLDSLKSSITECSPFFIPLPPILF